MNLCKVGAIQHWVPGKYIVLTSIWRMDNMKATLRCHTHVSRSLHRGTPASSTTPKLVSPILVWALGRRMIVSNSQHILPLTMFVKAQSPIKKHTVHASLRPQPNGNIITGDTKPTIFPNQWMRWRMPLKEWWRIWNDMKREEAKVENVSGTKLGKPEYP